MPDLSPVHLVVLVHGHLGYASDMAYLAKAVEGAGGAAVRVLNPRANEARTNAGVAALAHNLVAAIRAYSDETGLSHSAARVQLSFVGHSLGGLVARHAASLVAAQLPTWTLNHFVSVATPHLGSKFKSLIPATLAHAVAGHTGRDLFIAADTQPPFTPLLVRMAQAPFLDSLAAFKSRTAYGCVEHDLSVGFETSMMRVDNPLLQFSVSAAMTNVRGIMNSLPFVASMETSQPILTDISDHVKDAATITIPSNQLEDKEDLQNVQLMLHGLNSLNWCKLAITPTRPIVAHMDVIVKDELFMKQFGDSVIQDIVKRLLV
ncbi:putative serine esterase-domain-containing protein [Chytriomyces sp. MP71]|nr:putative serine esterase-domain-containing protein [Chytriomyces sp. MP71]